MLQHWSEPWLTKYTKSLHKVTLIELCTAECLKHVLKPLNYRWNKFGESDPYWIDAFRAVLIKKKLEAQLRHVDPWYYVQWTDPFPPTSKTILYAKEEERQWEPLEYASCPCPPPYNLQDMAAAGAADLIVEDAADGAGGSDLPAVTQYRELKHELDSIGDAAGTQSVSSLGVVTRSKARKENKLYPLREMLNGLTSEGVPVTTFVNVPLTSSELRNYKMTMPPLQKDLISLSESLDLFLGPNIYTFVELQHILGYLFTPEKRGHRRKAAMAYWDKTQEWVQDPAAAETKFPLVDPGWDSKNPEHRVQMADLKRIIVRGVKTAVPQRQNLAKAFEVGQLKDELPAEFLNRIKKSLNKYSGLAPDTPEYQALMKMQFVTKAWSDVQRKLQKLERWEESNIAVLLQELRSLKVRWMELVEVEVVVVIEGLECHLLEADGNGLDRAGDFCLGTRIRR
ncbi:hypothetical protein E2320_022872 [Naja naja]|nr:hypothetical protein E2320_022872 [Naja naja]